MRCPRCLGDGIAVEMDVVSSASTFVPPHVFRDERGTHHLHDPNTVETTYVCPDGHVHQEVEARACWCGWRTNTERPTYLVNVGTKEA